jgi:pilus assembly protein Flp/PilA
VRATKNEMSPDGATRLTVMLSFPGGRDLRRKLNRTHAQKPREGAAKVALQQFIRDDDGQGLVEYALIIAVIAIAVIVAMVFLRGQIENIFSNIGNNLT